MVFPSFFSSFSQVEKVDGFDQVYLVCEKFLQHLIQTSWSEKSYGALSNLQRSHSQNSLVECLEEFAFIMYSTGKDSLEDEEIKSIKSIRDYMSNLGVYSPLDAGPVLKMSFLFEFVQASSFASFSPALQPEIFYDFLLSKYLYRYLFSMFNVSLKDSTKMSDEEIMGMWSHMFSKGVISENTILFLVKAIEENNEENVKAVVKDRLLDFSEIFFDYGFLTPSEEQMANIPAIERGLNSFRSWAVLCSCLSEIDKVGFRPIIQEENKDTNQFCYYLKIAGLNNSLLNLTGCVMIGSNLEGVNFKSANLCNARFESSRLSGTNYDQANLQQCRFDGANIERSRINSCIGFSANFLASILNESQFLGGSFIDACFDYAELKNANFNAVDLTGSSFLEANLKGTVYEKSTLKQAVFYGAEMGGVKFNSIDLSSARFVSSNVMTNETNSSVEDIYENPMDLDVEEVDEVDVSSSRDLERNSSVKDMIGIEFIKCRLNLLNLNGVDLTGARFFDCDVNGSTFCGATMNGSSFDKSKLQDVNFKDAHGLKVELFVRVKSFSGAIGLPDDLIDQLKEKRPDLFGKEIGV
jgi:uncharacterized protein YjbI with pentapeptide repeats